MSEEEVKPVELKPLGDPHFLDQWQLTAIKKWFDEKEKKDGSCEFCGNANFVIQGHLVAPPIFGRGYVIGGMAYPQVMIVCSNCTNTKYFNAAMMGILKKKEEKNVQSSGK